MARFRAHVFDAIRSNLDSFGYFNLFIEFGEKNIALALALAFSVIVKRAHISRGTMTVAL